jgi:hypothetical protein
MLRDVAPHAMAPIDYHQIFLVTRKTELVVII